MRKITEAGLNNSSAQILPAHRTVLFTSRAGIGKMAILQRPGATNQGFQSIICNDGTDPYFIYSMGGVIKAAAERIAAGSTFSEISGRSLAGIEIQIPSLAEQRRIGEFFAAMDRLVVCRQRQVGLLKEQKKAYLQRMFPTPGETVPRLRFPGFTDPWEERRLGEVALISTGFPFESATFSDDGQFLVITNGNIQDDYSAVKDDVGNRVSITDTSLMSKYVLDIGDILVTMDGTVGRTAKVIRSNQVLAQRVGRVKAFQNKDFLYQWLNTGAFSSAMTSVSHGGTIKHISLAEINSYESPYTTNLSEQRAIGSFFAALDRLIALRQQELDETKQLKKAYLQRMFV